MAASNQFLNEVEDITECPICLQAMSNPKILPCIHTFCLKCLQEYGQRRKDGGEMTCPLCRTTVSIKNDDYSSLPNNTFLEKLIATKKSTNEKFMSEKNCDVCATIDAANKPVAASMYCLQCLEYMCDPCANIHRSMKMSKTHKFRSTTERPSFIECMQSSVSYCDKHQSKEIEIYCTECKTAGCMMCYVQHHQAHKCSDVNTFADEFRSRIGSDLQAIERLMSNYKKRVVDVHSISEKFAKKVDNTEIQITKKGELLKSTVDEHRQILLRDLDRIKQRQIREYTNLEEDLQVRLASMESFKRYSLEVLDKAGPSDIARIAKDISIQADELKLCTVTGVPEPATVDFNPSCLDQLIENTTWNMFGCISYSPSIIEPLSICYDKFPVFIKRKQFNATVRGVAVVKQKLFVIFESSLQIHVYNSITFDILQKVQLQSVSHLWDIVSFEDAICICAYYARDSIFTPEPDCLEVALHLEKRQCDCNVVIKLQLPNMTTSIWAVKDQECNSSSVKIHPRKEKRVGEMTAFQTTAQPGSISLTMNDNLLVCCTNARMLFEYTHNGGLMRTIPLSGGLQPNQVLRAFHLSNDQFLIQSSHAYVVDKFGRLLTTKSNRKGFHVVVDRKGSILAIDRPSDKLVSLDSSLTVTKQVHPRVSNFSQNSTKMYLDENEGRLYLIEDKTRSLAVLQFQMNRLLT